MGRIRASLLAMAAVAGCGDTPPADEPAGASDVNFAGAGQWSTCFNPTDELGTCADYCAQQGLSCAATCSTETRTFSPRLRAASLAWDGLGCNCDNPRCPASDRATGFSEWCDVPGYVMEGGVARGSVQCCCRTGPPDPAAFAPTECDDLMPGMWIRETVPGPLCGADGNGDYEELNFDVWEPYGPMVVRWSCFQGELVARSSGAYELYDNACSGILFGEHFWVEGDTLMLGWSGDARVYKHDPNAVKRPGNPSLGI